MKKRITMLLVAVVFLAASIAVAEDNFFTNTWSIKEGSGNDELARENLFKRIDRDSGSANIGETRVPGGLSWWQRELIEAKIEHLKRPDVIINNQGGGFFPITDQRENHRRHDGAHRSTHRGKN